jgi:phospholipid/cholesterol/gamma-HCH transport system substrate-binding protein
MGKQRAIEVSVGAFMAIALAALFFLAMQVSNLGAATGRDGYRFTARFHNVGSLRVRAPVNMAGVRIGRVETITVDQNTYEAVVTMHINAPYDRIPDDTFANIFTAGLLGEQYIGLDPGGSDHYLKEGGELTHTQSALVLEQLVGQLLFSKAGESAVGKKSDTK